MKVEHKNPQKGEILAHYKGNNYVVVGVAQHTEKDKKFLVYHSCDNENKLFIRPLKMIFEEINIPNIQQKTRFKRTGRRLVSDYPIIEEI